MSDRAACLQLSTIVMRNLNNSCKPVLLNSYSFTVHKFEVGYFESLLFAFIQSKYSNTVKYYYNLLLYIFLYIYHIFYFNIF